jgi:hypothetical protein
LPRCRGSVDKVARWELEVGDFLFVTALTGPAPTQCLIQCVLLVEGKATVDILQSIRRSGMCDYIPSYLWGVVFGRSVSVASNTVRFQEPG